MDLSQVIQIIPEADLLWVITATVLVFLMPPSLAALEERLRGRHTDSDEVIERRLKAARQEMGTAPRYDYVVINHDLERTREAVRAIMAAERCRASRVLGREGTEDEPILAQARLEAEREERT